MSARRLTPKGSPALQWWDGFGIEDQDRVLHWVMQNPPPPEWTEGPISWAWTEGPFGWIARVARLALDLALTGGAPSFILQENRLNIPRWWDSLGVERQERVAWWIIDHSDQVHRSPIAFAWACMEPERIELAPCRHSSPSPADPPQLCAWCWRQDGVVCWLSDPPPDDLHPNDSRVSHGICDDHAANLAGYGILRASELEETP